MKIDKFKKFESNSDNYLPKGWVNVKIDNQIDKRLAKYVKSLDDLIPSLKERNNLFKKIKMLSHNSMLSLIKDDNIGIQTKLSLITILQYLKEIKEHFHASSSGFLLESFLGSLLNAKVIDDYGRDDLVHDYEYKGIGRKLKYQIKLYKKDSSIKIYLNEDIDKRCDFYVIAIKDQDLIRISILNGKKNKTEEDKKTFIENFAVPQKKDGEIIRYDKDKPYIILNTNNKIFLGNADSQGFQYTEVINLNGIEELILNCGEIIMDRITKIYNHISDLEYHTESIITGRKRDKSFIDIDRAKKMADRTIERLSKELKNLTDDLKNG